LLLERVHAAAFTVVGDVADLKLHRGWGTRLAVSEAGRQHTLNARLEIMQVERFAHKIGRTQPQPKDAIHLLVAGAANYDWGVCQ